MAVEIASLLIEIDATQAESAEKSLDRLVAAGGRVESAAQRIKAATDKVTETYARSATAYDGAAKGANAYAAAEAKIERATQGSTAASAATRQARALEAAAMRELVQATNAYAKGQEAAAKLEQTLIDRNSAFRAAALVKEAADVAATVKATATSRQQAADLERTLVERNASLRASLILQEAAEVATATKTASAEREAAAKIELTLLERNAKLRADLIIQEVSDAAKAAQAQEAAAAKETAAWSALDAKLAARNDQLRGDQMLAGITAETAAVADLAKRAETLKGALEPAYAAQARFDAEMREASALFKAGAISASEYGARVAQLDAQSVAAVRGQAALGVAMARSVGSSKALTQAGLNLSRQFADVGVTAAMGMSPIMILIQQGPQIADAFQMAKTQGLSFRDVVKGLAVNVGLLTATVPAAEAAAAALAVSEQAAAEAALELAVANRSAATSAIAMATADQVLATTAAEAAAADVALTTATLEQAAATRATTVATAQLAAANTAVADTALAAAAAEITALAPLLPLIVAIAAVVAVVGLVTKATLDYSKAQQELEDASLGVGRAAGMTGDALQKAAQQGAVAGNTSIGQARALEVQLLRTGQVSGAVFASLLADQKRYAVAVGEDLPKAQADLAASFADPIRGLDTLSKRLGAVDGATRKLVTDLVAQNRIFEAQAVLAAALDKSLAHQATTTSLAGAAWEKVSNGIKGAYDNLGSLMARAALIQATGPVGEALANIYDHANARFKSKQLNNAFNAQAQAELNRASEAGSQVADQVNPYGGLRDLRNRQIVLQGSMDHEQNAAELKNQQEAYDRLTVAVKSYLTPAERANQLADLDVKATRAKTPAAQAEIAAERARIEAKGQAITASERQQRIDDAYRTTLAGATEALNEEAKAIRVDTAAALGLAEAYGQSAAAGFMAEAQRAAAARAAKGDISFAEAYQRQLGQDLANAVATGAKAAQSAQAQADAESKAADAIQFKGVVSAVAQRQMQDELAVRPLLIAQTVAQEVVTKAGTKATQDQIRTLNDATGALWDYRKALADSPGEQLRIQNETAAQAASDQVDVLHKEAEMLGATNVERAKAIALLQAEQQQRAAGFNSKTATPKQQASHDAAVTGAGNVAVADAGTQNATDRHNSALTEQLHLFQDLQSAAQAYGQGLTDVFGKAGAAIANVTDVFLGHAAALADITAQQKAVKDSGGDPIKEAELSRKAADLQVQAYADVLGAAASAFGKQTAAYKILHGAEEAYRIFQFAMAVKSILFKTAETGAIVANAGASVAADATTTTSTLVTSALKATAHGIVAIARAMADLPFPLNLIAGAATAAALVGFGVKVFGGGGGGSIPTSDATQKAQGAGTVLGDSAAKSASIAHSLDIVAKNTNTDLQYSNQMLRSLQSIDQNIGALTSQLAKQLGVGSGLFNTSGLGLGSASKLTGSGLFGPILGATPILGGLLDGVAKLVSKIPVIGGVLTSLFGTKTTKTLTDQGLAFNPQTLGSVDTSGLDGQTFQDIETKKKSKFFGISTGTKTTDKEITGALDSGVQDQLRLVVLSLRDGVLSAAGALGVAGAQAALDAFTVDIGKVSFANMTGDEIQSALQAVFSKLGDQMAADVLPVVTAFQKAGEGAFETLIRLANDYQTVDVTLQAMGKTFGAVGLSSIAAREGLVNLFGSLQDFVDASTFFTQNFLSEAEQIAPIQAAVQKEFARLGVSGVNNIDQFKQLVMGLDLTTDAGQQMYASLLAVAPAFKKVFDYLNPDAANAAADGWRSVFQSLTDWIHQLNGEITASAQSTAQAYAALQAAGLAARNNDLAAAGKIVDLGNAYLTAAKASASSELDYLLAVSKARAIASSVQAYAASNAGMATGVGSATPFSPATSATGSMQPSYTYTPRPAFSTGGSFTIGGTGSGDSQDFGSWHGSPGEVVNISRKDNMEAVAAALREVKTALDGLKEDNRIGFTKLAGTLNRAVKVLEDWDGAGLPPDRTAEEAA